MVWGVIARTIYVWHITWAVNSPGHMCAYRNFETDEASRNNWFVAFITEGEGWHNNHHHDPTRNVGFARYIQRADGTKYDVIPSGRGGIVPPNP